MQVDGVDINWDITRAVVGLKELFLPKNTSAYLKMGLGYFNYKLTASSGSMSASASESDLGLALGGGVQSKGHGQVGGFAELMYNNIFSEGEALRFLDIRGGVTFSFGDRRRAP